MGKNFLCGGVITTGTADLGYRTVHFPEDAAKKVDRNERSFPGDPDAIKDDNIGRFSVVE